MKSVYRITCVLLVVCMLLPALAACSMGGEYADAIPNYTPDELYTRLVEGYENLKNAKSYRAEYFHDDGMGEATIYSASLQVASDTPGAALAAISYNKKFWHYTDLVYYPFQGGQYYCNGSTKYWYSEYAYDQVLPTFKTQRQSAKDSTFVEKFYRQILTYLEATSFEEMARRFCDSEFTQGREKGLQAFRLTATAWDMYRIFVGEEKAWQERNEALTYNPEMKEEILQRYALPCELVFYLTDDGYLAGLYYKHSENRIEEVNHDHRHRELSFLMTEINRVKDVTAPEWTVKGFERPASITPEAASAIKAGMTYYDVVMQIGKPMVPEDETVLYREWKVDGKGTLRVTFNDGERGGCVAQNVEYVQK